MSEIAVLGRGMCGLNFWIGKLIPILTVYENISYANACIKSSITNWKMDQQISPQGIQKLGIILIFLFLISSSCDILCDPEISFIGHG